MKKILVQNTEDCKSISVENAVNSAREDIMKEGFTVKQVADKLNVSYDTVNNTVKKLNLKVEVLRLSGSDKPTRVLTKDQAKQIADCISRGRRQQTKIAQFRSETERASFNEQQSSVLTSKDIELISTVVSMTVAKTIEALDKRMSKIETRIEERQSLLPPPSISPRSHINMLVRDYSSKTG